jgi:hypothetical protein
MKKCLILLIISLLSINVVNAQNLDSARIYINPGHGGHDSNDRFIAETGFWESEQGIKIERYPAKLQCFN